MFFLISFAIFLWHCLLRIASCIRQHWQLHRCKMNFHDIPLGINDYHHHHHHQNAPFLNDFMEEKLDLEENIKGIFVKNFKISKEII